MTLTVNHVFTNPQADFTGTVTVHDSAGGTKTLAATNLARPSDWNSVHVIAGAMIEGIAASDTTYTSGTVVLSGGANITVGTNGQTITFSAPNQTVQTQNLVAISASNALFSSGTVTMSGFGAATVNTAAGLIRISVPVQTTQIETQTFVGGIAMNAATTYTSGTVVLSAGNNITLGSNAQTITISGVAAQTVQTQNLVAISASNALFSSGTVTISGFGDVTVNTAAGLIRISAPVQTAQTFVGGIAVNALTTYTSGTVVLSDSNGVTFGTNAQTVTASVNQSISMFAVSNTTQSSSGTAHKSALSFAGAGIASVGVTGGSVVISVPSGGGAGDGGVFAGVSTGGNTAGSTGTVSTGNFVLVGSNGITLSQSTGAAGSAATITIFGPQVTESGFNPYPDMVKVVGQAQGSLQFDPMIVRNVVQFDRVVMVIHNTNSSNSSGSHTLSFWGGLYTRNAATLSLLQSWSTSTAVTHSGTAGSYSLFSGQRLVTIPFTTTLTAGQYWLGIVSRTTSGGANGSYSLQYGSNINTVFNGHFGSSHATTAQLTLGQGNYTVTTNGIPSAVSFSQIRGSESEARRPAFVMFASGTV